MKGFYISSNKLKKDYLGLLLNRAVQLRSSVLPSASVFTKNGDADLCAH